MKMKFMLIELILQKLEENCAELSTKFSGVLALLPHLLKALIQKQIEEGGTAQIFIYVRIMLLSSAQKSYQSCSIIIMFLLLQIGQQIL